MWWLMLAAQAADPTPSETVDEAPEPAEAGVEAPAEEPVPEPATAPLDGPAPLPLPPPPPEPEPALKPEWAPWAATALDDRVGPGKRAKALRELGALDDPELLWIVRAAAQDRVAELQAAALDVAARYQDPEAVAILAWVLTDRASDPAMRQRALNELATHGTREAGDALWLAASDRRVPARLRKTAGETLAGSYPEVLAARGEPRNVVDPLGGALFIGGSGLAGGIALSSVGVWGQFDGSEAIGAVGGSAIGLGTGALYVGNKPLTTGQGLAWASGVSWGLAAGAWTTSAIHGPWVAIDGERRRTAVDAGAAYRLVGVTAGALAGAAWMRKDPDAWDVVEVDLAGYLGSAVFLAGTGLAVWDPTPPPEDTYGTPTYDPYYTTTYGTRPTRPDTSWEQLQEAQAQWEEDRLPEYQILSASNLVGAGIGIGAGLALRDKWKLGWEDAAFATTLGLEAAWIGNFAPDALGVDDRYLKGTVRLPWNAAIIGGLVLAEVHPMPFQTSAVTAAGGLSLNALGAGLPMLAQADEQTTAAVMVPVGLAGTTAGVLAAPWLDPHGGEWTMVSVGSGIGFLHGMFLGRTLEDVGFDGDQVVGLALTTSGAVAPTLLTIGHYADPASDDMLTAGAAWGWGAVYGIATPYALRTGAGYGTQFLAGTITGDVFLVATAVALTDKVGLEPRHTLVPQLLGVTGGTVGALGVAMFDSDSEDVVLGGLVGATTGLVGGGVITALAPPKPRRGGHPVLRIPGRWTPAMFPATPTTPVQRVGVQVTGW